MGPRHGRPDRIQTSAVWVEDLGKDLAIEAIDSHKYKTSDGVRIALVHQLAERLLKRLPVGQPRLLQQVARRHTKQNRSGARPLQNLIADPAALAHEDQSDGNDANDNRNGRQTIKHHPAKGSNTFQTHDRVPPLNSQRHRPSGLVHLSLVHPPVTEILFTIQILFFRSRIPPLSTIVNRGLVLNNGLAETDSLG